MFAKEMSRVRTRLTSDTNGQVLALGEPASADVEKRWFRCSLSMLVVIVH